MQIGAASAMIWCADAVPLQATRTKARPYMQPTDLKAIARDAALRGDTKTLFHTLAANPYYAAHTRRVSPAALRLPQPKLPGNSNHIARGRIRQFES